MLSQIVLSGSVFQDIGDQFPHYIKLMEPGEDQGLLHRMDFDAVIFRDDFLLFLIRDELLKNIQQAVLLQNVLPDIRGYIVPVRSLGIASPAVFSSAVVALVEREEERLVTVEPGCHGCLIQIDGKECENAVIVE